MEGVFRFQDGPVDVELQTDMMSLQSLAEGQLLQLVKVVLCFLSSADSSILVDGAQAFAEEHGVNVAALKSTLLAMLVFFRGAARKHLSQELLAQDLERFGLAQSKAQAVGGLWMQHLGMLSRSMVDQTMSANRLVDLEWRFGVTAASSELEQVGRTFLQVKLLLDKGGVLPEETTMELTLPQFYDFLQEMEKAKATMDLLSKV